MASVLSDASGWMIDMADNTPDGPQHPTAPEPDPWATTPRHQLKVPPEGESPFARPAENPWQAPGPTRVDPAPAASPPTLPAEPANPYATASWGSEPTSQLPPYPGAMPPPPPPAAYPLTSSGTGASTGAGAYPSTTSGNWGAAPTRDANPISALFDFSFTKFATPGLVKIVYILQVVAAVGVWLIWLLGALAGNSFGGGPGMALVVLLFGWIPVLLSIAFTRFILEGVVALIRIHDRVAEIAQRQPGDSV